MAAFRLVAMYLRDDDHGRLRATDVSYRQGLAPLWVQVVEILRWSSGYEDVALLPSHIAHKMLCNGNLGLRLFAERHAYGVSEAVCQQRTDTHGTLDAPVFTLSSLCHTKMKRVVHVLSVHLGHQ